MKGYDDTFNPHVHQVYDYKNNEIEFDSDFEPMFDSGIEGIAQIFVDKISSTKRL